jgi:hypothetical protein
MHGFSWNLDKHALVSFSKTSNSTRPSDSCNFDVFEKLTRACYIQIALETMLLPILIDVSTFFKQTFRGLFV